MPNTILLSELINNQELTVKQKLLHNKICKELNAVIIDKAIQNLRKGKTVIVVAHRLSALKMCNRVAVVENHTITSVGTHEEVRKNNAYYRNAWKDYETARNITYQLEGGEQHE